MIPEIGHFALILALCIAVVLSVVPMVGSFAGRYSWMALARPASTIQFLLVGVSYATLTYAFVTNDFSVDYVANTSNLAQPMIYKITGVWGSHEGSLLLWLLVLTTWTALVSIFSRGIPLMMISRVLSVLGMISVGFTLFVLLTSNPFNRTLPAPLDGQALNPLLQDFGLVIHPPMLYMGYVGFSVAFAFAVAALIGGRLDMAWAKWMRPWTNVAWVFLTIGIGLGSWWAYYELGWGGWWFWDPVENASFMPWLVGTALIHTLAATEKRGAFKAWTVLLAVTAFALSLLGTFLVRSGVLTSVHAFANDPERGQFILAFLGVVVGSSLVLYAWRAPKLVSDAKYNLESRESGLLFNNVVMVVICASVLIGTLYPLFLDAMGMNKLSVGAPYFNIVFIPLGALVAVVVGVAALARWKKDNLREILYRLRWAMVVSVIGAAVLPFAMGTFKFGAALGIGLALWVTCSSLQGVYERVIGHIGIAVFAVGVSLTSLYSVERDLRLDKGETVNIAGYDFAFGGVKDVNGPNYTAEEGILTVTKEGKKVTVLTAQKRDYNSQMGIMTEAGIDAGLSRDLFFALGESLGPESWSVRIYVMDKRYRRVRSSARDTATSGAAAVVKP